MTSDGQADTRPHADTDPRQYIQRQIHWHPEEVYHLMPRGRDLPFFLFRWDKRVHDTIAALPPGRVLDVGCGDGRDVIQLQSEGWQGFGAEPSSKQVDDARRVMEQQGHTVTMVRSLAEKLPFKPATFDVISCKSAIDHVIDRESALDDFASVVKPGGRVIVSVVNFADLSARISRPLFWLSRKLNIGDPSKPRFWDTHVPHEHTFEGTCANMKALAGSRMKLVECYGVSLFFGVPRWGWLLRKVPERWANRLLETADSIARRHPSLADVVVCVWERPA